MIGIFSILNGDISLTGQFLDKLIPLADGLVEIGLHLTRMLFHQVSHFFQLLLQLLHLLFVLLVHHLLPFLQAAVFELTGQQLVFQLLQLVI